MTVGVLEVQPAATIVAVDFAGTALAGVGPVLESPPSDASKDMVKVLFAYQEGIVLRVNFGIGLVKVERDIIVELDDQEWSKSAGSGQAQDIGEEYCRHLLIAAPDDGVIKLNAHVIVLLS